MKITIRHTEGCPNVASAEERVREALHRMSAEAEIRFELVATGEEAADLGFVGSPTILIDGKDPFVRSVDGFALACRIYQTADGPDGAPTVDQLCAALSALGSTQ